MNSYSCGMETSVRELKDHLSQYMRRIEAGERVVVAFDRLIASGVISPPAEDGDPLEGCPEIRLAPGTAAALIESRVRDNATALGHPVE